MEKSESLYILWTSSELETFDELVFMYAFNAKKYNWWDEVTVVIWGASARLAGSDELVQLKIKEMIEEGVRVEACKACADDLGVSAKLETLGVVVKYWGQPLTKVLKSGAKLITI
jgi:hypothetical protein